MSPPLPEEIDRAFRQLDMLVFERGWLSSNNILLRGAGSTPATVVDTGYAAHAEQTVTLIASELKSVPLGNIVNTHLHSDHCGGNAALQARWDSLTWIPAACWEAVNSWDQGQLSFAATDQRCDRFAADQALSAGQTVLLGKSVWQVHSAAGHDPTALMFYQPDTGVLISGDALWEQRLAIVFPELVGAPGFDACMQTLDTIERLAPRIVIPGHGRPFSDVAGALTASRSRLDAFQRQPARHRRHALRALVMFHMFEIRHCDLNELIAWLWRTPITSGAFASGEVWAEELITGLVTDGALQLRGDQLCMPKKQTPADWRVERGLRGK